MASATDVYGPITPTFAQYPEVVAVPDRVFLNSAPGHSMAINYGYLFYNGQRLEQLRVFMADGRPVSLVGMTRNTVRVFDGEVKLTCIGCVSTLPEYRGRDFAGRLLDDAVERAMAWGASLMLISGERSLYVRRGALAEGLYHRYIVDLKSDVSRATGLEIRELAAGEAASALALFEQEPICYLRSVEDYRFQLVSVTKWSGGTFGVWENRKLKAVVSVTYPPDKPDQPRRLIVKEKAGSWRHVLEALAFIAEQRNDNEAQIDTYTFDEEMVEIGRERNISLQQVGIGGTVKLLDAPALWLQNEPLLRERIGAHALKQIKVSQRTRDLAVESVTFSMGNEAITINGVRESLASMVGSPQISPLAEAPGRFGETMRQALPLPLPLYGLNYV